MWKWWRFFIWHPFKFFGSKRKIVQMYLLCFSDVSVCACSLFDVIPTKYEWLYYNYNIHYVCIGTNKNKILEHRIIIKYSTLLMLDNYRFYITIYVTSTIIYVDVRYSSPSTLLSTVTIQIVCAHIHHTITNKINWFRRKSFSINWKLFAVSFLFAFFHLKRSHWKWKTIQSTLKVPCQCIKCLKESTFVAANRTATNFFFRWEKKRKKNVKILFVMPSKTIKCIFIYIRRIFQKQHSEMRLFASKTLSIVTRSFTATNTFWQPFFVSIVIFFFLFFVSLSSFLFLFSFVFFVFVLVHCLAIFDCIV